MATAVKANKKNEDFFPYILFNLPDPSNQIN